MLSAYKNKQVIDILVSGYSEKEKSGLRFSPLFSYIYLKFEDRYLVLNANYGNITIMEETELKCYFDIEEDDYFTVSSILKHEYGNVIKDIDYFYEKNNLLRLGMQMQNHYILFDSLNINGFIVGEYKTKVSAIENIE